MTNMLKSQGKSGANRVIENHAVGAFAVALVQQVEGTPPFLPGHAPARFDPRGGPAPQVRIPLRVTPYRFSGLAQKSTRTCVAWDGVGGVAFRGIRTTRIVGVRT